MLDQKCREYQGLWRNIAENVSFSRSAWDDCHYTFLIAFCWSGLLCIFNVHWRFFTWVTRWEVLIKPKSPWISDFHGWVVEKKAPSLRSLMGFEWNNLWLIVPLCWLEVSRAVLFISLARGPCIVVELKKIEYLKWIWIVRNRCPKYHETLDNGVERRSCDFTKNTLQISLESDQNCGRNIMATNPTISPKRFLCRLVCSCCGSNCSFLIKESKDILKVQANLFHRYTL